MKKQTKKSLSYWLAIGVLGLLAIGGVVKASGGEFSWASVEEKVAQLLVQGLGGEEKLGASGTRFPNGISADTTSPVAGEVRGTTLTITGATTISGASDVSTFTQGGGVFTTSTTGAVLPLLAANFDTENLIDVTLNVSDGTLSFPATTTLTSFIPNTGDTRTLYIRNATTTASMDLTISGGTGVLLKVASSTPATSIPIIYGDTDGGNFGIMTLIRKADTDIEALLQVYKD